MDIERAKEILLKLGVELSLEGEDPHSFDPWVDLRLTRDQWWHMTTTNGDYYSGHCCDLTDQIQDIVSRTYRHNPNKMPLMDVIEIGDLSLRHGDKGFKDGPWNWDHSAPHNLKAQPGWRDWDSLAESGAWDKLSPWERLAIVYHLFKDTQLPVVSPNVPNKKPYWRAIDAASIVADAVSRISWHRIVIKGFPEDGSWDIVAQQERALMLAPMLPALKVICEEIDALSLGDFEGWAVAWTATQNLCEGRYGAIVGSTKAEVVHLVDQWNELQMKKDGRVISKEVSLVPVRMSYRLPKGYEFTGPLEPAVSLAE